ncbi:hypothetical protein VP01_365g1 [Puccinia sorghi]|uniref:MICOS complex subunit n=1 Tax=Puccinia sorghi TaxID=27349 RepID=A0A0L6UV85_9BASI|nr:hypothetical protein VP01_365g1 [Puccinia sorghi]
MASSIESQAPNISRKQSDQRLCLLLQLPIYDEPSEEIILVKTELPLQPQVRWVRQNMQSFKRNLEGRFNVALDHGLMVEKKVSQLLFAESDCVGIGTMTGSILARNRSLPLRFLSPLAFFVLSSNQFLPSTTHNLKSYIFKLQDHHFPQSAAARDQLIKQGTEGVEWLKQLKRRLLLKTTEVVHDGSQAFEKYSGLNISHNTSVGKDKTD